MSATTKRSLLTLGALVFGGASQSLPPGTPQLVAVGLSALAGFFAAWAHMDKPSDPPAAS